ncbi:CubicO group peptidase, beta-lactamase class C family [Brevibacterium casei CIP 102111]|uniref:CubicO group peptidase, beta-lactamase class C family n=3 Tax=Brevibacterium casei TaxID=33889 RepID=A0A2H1HRY3_9MICO|nr:serine hydrolase [Brevibacterium casei]QPR41131.1 serine hydrolase [Brevibacterium casei]QPR45656.1 serine hydrolase [Brevibacterium casei]SMX65661.1 CubicO group peptidase, beta-lactamase class C family [Brevibacterium casei CIP 102111]
MADMKKVLHSLTHNPATRRIGALSGNTKGIDGDEKSDAERTQATDSSAGEGTDRGGSGDRGEQGSDGPDRSHGTDRLGEDPTGDDAAGSGSGAAGPGGPGKRPLPHVGELTSASEEAIVDPSEAILESIDLDSWKWPEYFAFALTRMEEIFPSAGIPRGIGSVCEYISQDNDFRSLTIDAKKWTAADDEGWTTVGDVLANTFTDAWLVTRGGVAIAEEYAWPMKPARRHMLFSVSKSIVSIVVGALADAGLLRVDDLVTTHVPALGKSGYAGATIRDLLDMRSGVKFSEEYLEDGSEIRRLFEAVDFAPRTPTSAHGIKDFLTGLTSERDHGSSFVYRSCETDVLAWVCENVVGRPFAVVASEFVWSRIGAAHAAQVCQDRWGGSIADGAISTTLRDLGRFGEMIARGGVNADGTRVVSEAWVDDIFAGGPDSAQVFAESASGQSYPGGMYRSQFWVPSASRDVVIGIGIHGQMLYVDRATQTVGVKLSSDPEPVSLAAQHGTLAMFEAITEAVPAEVVPPTPSALPEKAVTPGPLTGAAEARTVAAGVPGIAGAAATPPAGAGSGAAAPVGLHAGTVGSGLVAGGGIGVATLPGIVPGSYAY